MKHHTVTVTQGAWGVSVMTGSGIEGAILHVYQHHGQAPRFFTRKGDGYGRRFESSDAAWSWALAHGYTQPYYSRTWCREHRTLHTFMGRPSGVSGKCWHRPETA